MIRLFQARLASLVSGTRQSGDALTPLPAGGTVSAGRRRFLSTMFKIPQKTEYGLRAMIELAIHRGKGLISAREIAEAQHIPLRFLEQQLGALSKAGLVESFRGAGGGCRLVRDPAEIRIADIVDAIEGPSYP